VRSQGNRALAAELNDMANLQTHYGNRVQRIERILLGIGLSLLGIFAVAQIYRVVASRSAIAHFTAKTHSSENPTFTIDPAAGSRVDFRLWANNRIAAYKESLVEKTDLPLAILRIRSVVLEVPIFDGTDELTLNRGIGRIEGTARIGKGGNLGLAGHRDGFFRVLKDIQLGDAVELVLQDRTDQYVVTQTQIVAPEDTGVLAQTTTPTLTLVTCFPFYYVGSAPKRFIVTALFKNSSPRVRDRQSRSDGQ